MTMPKRLTNLTISEISLVDEPANEDARVMIVKAKNAPVIPLGGVYPKSQVALAVMAAIDGLVPEIVEKAAGEFPADNTDAAADAAANFIKELVMNFEDVTKALEAAEVQIDTLTKRATDAETAAAEAAELLKAKEAELAEIAKANEDPAAAEAEIMKSLPESIRKRLEDADAVAKAAQEELQKSKDAAEAAEYVAKARALNAGDADVIGGLLQRVAKGKTTAEDAATVEAVLKSAAAVTATSDLFKSLGAAGDDKAMEPGEALLAKAKELQAADPKLTDAVAYEKALEQNPALYTEYLAKRR
jgi:hypothetical protein